MFFGQELLCIPEHVTTLGAKMKTEAQRDNLVLFMEMFNRFSNIAVTRIDWHGLPESVNERFLNQTLYLYGSAVFFRDENLGLLALPATMSGEFNIYYEPTSVQAYSFNYNKRLQYGEFVYIRNNPTCTPTAFPVYEYTKRMSDILRTIDVLCKKMKQPFMFACDEKQRQTYLNLVKKVQDNETIILGVKDWDFKKEAFKILETPVPTDLTKLWEMYSNMERLLYTALGIESVGIEKRERLLVDEVNANNMVTQMGVDVTMKQLESACEEINKKYNLNVSVSAKGIEYYREGVGNSGSLYDNPSGISES